MFEEEFTPNRILENGNIPKYVPDREGYIVMRCKNNTTKPSSAVPTEQEINKKAKFSLNDLEKEIKENNRKIKTACTYMNNVFKSVSAMEETLKLIDNKVVLIYHYIESGNCKNEEEKVRITNLLNRILVIRRELKKQRAVYAQMTTTSTLSKLNDIKGKLKPFEYWTYPSLDDFIGLIENGEEEIK